jgi:hypothetical protein
LLDTRIDGFPAAQVEIANTEVGPFRYQKGLLKSREQCGFNVVENAGHDGLCAGGQ